MRLATLMRAQKWWILVANTGNYPEQNYILLSQVIFVLVLILWGLYFLYQATRASGEGSENPFKSGD